MSTEGITRSIQEMRIDVLTRITEACVTEGLAAPLSVMVFAHHSLNLRVDDDLPEQVDAWAEFLGLPAPDDHLIKGRFIDHGSRDGTWRGLRVAVWCAVNDPDEVARLSALAALEA